MTPTPPGRTDPENYVSVSMFLVEDVIDILRRVVESGPESMECEAAQLLDRLASVLSRATEGA